MDWRGNGTTARLCALAVAVQATVSVALADGRQYIHEDVRIAGQEIHAFVDEGKHVSVVLGKFRLTLGKRVVSGRDAVVWIRTHKVGRT